MRTSVSRWLLPALTIVLFTACGPGAETGGGDDPRAALIARGEALELPGEWETPPGDPLVHSTSGFAKILCSAVFLTGLDPADAAENVGYFTSAYEDRVHVTDTVVDYEREEVRLTLPSGVTRIARRYGSQGCVTLPLGEDSVFFAPSRRKRARSRRAW